MQKQTPNRGNSLVIGVLILAVLGGGAYWYMQSDNDEMMNTNTADTAEQMNETNDMNGATNEAMDDAMADAALDPTQQLIDGPVTVTPISHATMVVEWYDTVMYMDPVGGAEAFAGMPAPNVILLTDTDGDHFSTSTLAAIATEEVTMVAPSAVAEQLPTDLQAQTIVMSNGDEQTIGEFTLTAVPMYNLPPSDDGYHPVGKGNGYVIDDGEYRLYNAGDTEATKEFRAQEEIDLAFVPMNLPYTMGVEQAAEGVAEMNPDMVVPFHFRGQGGFSDVGEFKTLLNEQNAEVTVRFLDFYPDTEADLPPST